MYDTVGKRSTRAINASWAPWWRAQAYAIDHVARVTYPEHAAWADKVLKKELSFAQELERKGT